MSTERPTLLRGIMQTDQFVLGFIWLALLFFTARGIQWWMWGPLIVAYGLFIPYFICFCCKRFRESLSLSRIVGTVLCVLYGILIVVAVLRFYGVINPVA